MYIGIDLGTTYSAVAFCDEDSGKPVVEECTLGSADGRQQIESVVYVPPGGDVVVGSAALNMYATEPARVFQWFKRHLGEEDTKARYEIDGRTFTPEMLSAEVLKVLKKDALAWLDGEEVTGAVVCVPAWFGDRQRDATKTAVRHFGQGRTSVTFPVGRRGHAIDVTLEEFNEVTDELLQRTRKRLEKVLEQGQTEHGVKLDELAVILCGGSSKLPGVAPMLTELVGHKPIVLKKTNPEKTVDGDASSDDGIELNMSYHYHVVLELAGGIYSHHATQKIATPPRPRPPVDIKLEESAGKFHIKWQPPTPTADSPVSYHVFRFHAKKDFEPSSEMAYRTTNEQHIVDQDLQLAERYCYAVVAYGNLLFSEPTWTSPSVAYAEAEEFSGESLPDAVRLAWIAPAASQEARVERLDAERHVERSWQLPQGRNVHLDSSLAGREIVSYRLSLRFGDRWSDGLVKGWTPLAPSIALPRQLSAPAEVKDLSVAAWGGTVSVSWSMDHSSPDGDLPVLVALRGTRHRHVVSGNQTACQFDKLPPGSYEVVARRISRTGELSSGTTVTAELVRQ
jgi:hypothetical protein